MSLRTITPRPTLARTAALLFLLVIVASLAASPVAHAEAPPSDAPRDFSTIDVREIAPLDVPPAALRARRGAGAGLDGAPLPGGYERYDAATGRVDTILRVPAAPIDDVFGIEGSAPEALAIGDASASPDPAPSAAPEAERRLRGLAAGALSLDVAGLDSDALLRFGGLERVYDTDADPWSRNVKIFMRFPSDRGWSSCSGALIGARHLLTAGHCVFDHESGGWFQQLIAVPGYDDGHEPFGRARGTRAISWSGWTQEADFDADLAVVRLDRTIGEQTGWFGYGYHELRGPGGNVVDCEFYRDGTFHNASYPAEVYGGHEMYYRHGSYDRCEGGNQLLFDGDTYGGMSGSGFYRKDDSGRYVEAVTSYSVRYHDGSAVSGTIRINADRFQHIQDFMEE